MKLTHADFYIRSMGKLLKVTDIFHADIDGVCEANARMEKVSELAVVAEVDGFVFLASKYDKGLLVRS